MSEQPPLTHDEAIKALCDCAATVTVLSYQEAVESYFRLRALPDPARPDERDMATAPKDDTTIWLLVDYSPDDAWHPLVDANRAWTLGMNSFDNTGEDAWRFVGWCWSHDHFTEGRGTPVAWKPIGFDLDAQL